VGFSAGKDFFERVVLKPLFPLLENTTYAPARILSAVEETFAPLFSSLKGFGPRGAQCPFRLAGQSAFFFFFPFEGVYKRK